MKIQEIKSGILHLHKKMESERRENVFEMRPTVEANAAPASPSTPHCELDEPRWSVISFDRREGGSLTYDQAAMLMEQLNATGVSGLCIVTDQAAADRAY